MSQDQSGTRKYSKVINYLQDFPGASIADDAVKVILVGDEYPDDMETIVNNVVSVQEDSPLDVSSATVNIQEDTPLDVSGATVTVTDDGALDINSLPEPLDVSAATVPTEQQTPVGVEDSNGTQVDPINQSDTGQIQDSTTTAGNNVSLDLGDLRDSVDIIADVSGSATLTISVSTTGNFSGEQHDVLTIDYTSSGVNLEQFDFAYQHVQASVDSNLNELEIVSRGI